MSAPPAKDGHTASSHSTQSAMTAASPPAEATAASAAQPTLSSSTSSTSSSFTSSAASSSSVAPSSSSSTSASASASASAAHVHDTYFASRCPRPPSFLPKIDLHTHILPEHIPDLAKRFGYGTWVSLQPDPEHRCCASMFKGDKVRGKRVERRGERGMEGVDSREKREHTKVRASAVVAGADSVALLCVTE